MYAALAPAVAAICGAFLAAAAAIYGSRGANRAAKEGTAVTGFNSLTDQLQEERTELRAELLTLRAELAAERAEVTRLKTLVQSLGGTP